MIADIPLLPILAKLAEGLLATLALALLAFVLGGATGLLVLFARVGRSLNLRRLAKAYIQAFQNTPLLMQIFLTYFGLALLGIDTCPMKK